MVHTDSVNRRIFRKVYLTLVLEISCFLEFSSSLFSNSLLLFSFLEFSGFLPLLHCLRFDASSLSAILAYSVLDAATDAEQI